MKFITDTAPYGSIKSLRSDRMIFRDYSVIIVFDTKLLRLINHTKMGQQKDIGEPYLKWLDAWSLKTIYLKVYGPTL